jgi:hypothetical protein
MTGRADHDNTRRVGFPATGSALFSTTDQAAFRAYQRAWKAHAWNITAKLLARRRPEASDIERALQPMFADNWAWRPVIDPGDHDRVLWQIDDCARPEGRDDLAGPELAALR